MILITALLVTFAGGIVMAVQSPTNTVLSKYIGNMQSTMLNFLVGLGILTIGVLLIGSGDLSRVTEAEPWMLFGGLYGVSIVLSITYVVPVLGVAMTLTIIMLGQLIMGAVIDAFGWLRCEVIPITPLRVFGCLIIACGILMVYRGRKSGSVGKIDRAYIRAAAVMFVTGLVSAMQSPTNVALSGIIGTIEASLINFLVGTIAIFLILMIRTKGRPLRGAQTRGIRPWMLIGGLYGATSVFINVLVTPHLGVTLMIAANTFGQLGGAMVIDSRGLLRTEKISLSIWRLIGSLLVLAGVILVSITKAL
ncbi:MAG: DMT family transporter [Anaerovoracaceae bacterium]|jgi:transporter family-2 protein